MQFWVCVNAHFCVSAVFGFGKIIGTSSLSLLVFLLFVVFVFPCSCVLRLGKEGVRRLHLGAVETFFIWICIRGLVYLGTRSYVVTSFAYAFACARFVFRVVPRAWFLVSVRSGSRPSASTQLRVKCHSQHLHSQSHALAQDL